MKKLRFHLLAVAVAAFVVSGCLTVEKKQYTFEMKGNGAGTLTIKYVNIMSQMDDSVDVSADDFDELINKYLNGDELEGTYKGATNFRKRLFEENGVLCGELKVDFTNLASVKLFQMDKKSPYVMSLGGSFSSETYQSSNGVYGGDVISAVFWPAKEKKLMVTTSVADPTSEKNSSLLKRYKAWK